MLRSVGHALRFAADPLGFVARRFESYGDIYFVPGQPHGLFVIRHPDHARQVLLDDAARYHKTHSVFDRLSSLLGDGLLTTDGELWKRHRRMIQPAFTRTQIGRYADVAVGEARRAAATWSVGRTYDMAAEMMSLTLRIVCRSLFSHDVSGDADRVGAAMHAFQAAVTRPDVFPGWVPSRGRRRLRRAIAELDRIVYGMIDERRRGAARRDLLQTLLDAADDEAGGERLSEREVRDHLVTLFLAGHETTSNALTWTWYLLSRNRDAEQRLHAELDRVLDGRPPTFADLPRLAYAEQVIKEAMRFYPPAYVLARRAREDTTIGGYPVPAGSEVVVWIYMTHRDPRWFPEPERFLPERFTPELEAARPRLAYLPFGAGPRACIGKQFAMVEAVLILASLAQRFHFELDTRHKIKTRPRLTLTPNKGMRMQLQVRARPARRAAR